MDIELRAAVDADRLVLRRLLQLYHYDLSEVDGSDVDLHGEYLHRYFDEYFDGGDRLGLLFTVGGSWAGFALLYTGEPHDIAEFFVMRKYRRRGVGRQVAQQLFSRYPGAWTIRQQRTNPAATAFWRAVVPQPFDEEIVGTEIVQRFSLL